MMTKAMNIRLILPILALFGAILSGCTVNPKYKTVAAKRIESMAVADIVGDSQLPVQKIFYANASWYGKNFHGRSTASGEQYDMNDYTCAHRELPFGTKLRVVNEDNGKAVVVRVNDRGPYVSGRDFDLSYDAARSIGLVGPGTKELRFELLGR